MIGEDAKMWGALLFTVLFGVVRFLLMKEAEAALAKRDRDFAAERIPILVANGTLRYSYREEKTPEQLERERALAELDSWLPPSPATAHDPLEP